MNYRCIDTYLPPLRGLPQTEGALHPSQLSSELGFIGDYEPCWELNSANTGKGMNQAGDIHLLPDSCITILPRFVKMDGPKNMISALH